MLIARRHLFRLGTAAALVAVLVTFVVAVWWWGQQSQDDAARGMTGPYTVLTVYPDDLRPSRPHGMADLTAYLDKHQIPLLIVCTGDTRPGVAALGPPERVPWLSHPVPPGEVLLIDGSYAARRWTARHTVPGFVPRGVRVSGFTSGPPNQHFLQFVVGSVSALPTADYVIGTRNPGEVKDVAVLLAVAGAPTSRPVDMPAESMWHNPAVVGIVLMLMSALACLALDWSLLAGRLMPRLQLVRRHGASGRAVVGRMLLTAAPALMVGSLVGATATFLIRLADSSATRHLGLVAWPIVGLASGVLVGAVWTIVVVSASRIAVRRAG